MKLVVGLGNPGLQYETTRHNVGFLAVDRLMSDWGATGATQRFQAEVAQANIGSEKVFLVKPQTYMNLSGQSVREFMDYFRCDPTDLVVIHDELDLPPMSLRIKVGGGAGGHNGIKSIDENLGKERSQYFRVRVGIGHPRTLSTPEKPLQISAANYVLQPFSDPELVQLDGLFDDLVKLTQDILNGNAAKAMNQYHRTKESK